MCKLFWKSILGSKSYAQDFFVAIGGEDCGATYMN